MHARRAGPPGRSYDPSDGTFTAPHRAGPGAEAGGGAALEQSRRDRQARVGPGDWPRGLRDGLSAGYGVLMDGRFNLRGG